MHLVRYCAIFLVLCTALFTVKAFAGDFSADMLSSTLQGAFKTKIYVSGDKSRMETPEAITISRMDKSVVWMLMPGGKMYIEQAINPQAAASIQEKVSGEIERQAEGNETIDGRNTTKYRVTFEMQGKRESVFQWIDETEHIPVKTAAIDGSWSTEFKNIQTGPQKQDLFEIPAGYSKMSLDMPSMKDIMGNTE